MKTLLFLLLASVALADDVVPAATPYPPGYLHQRPARHHDYDDGGDGNKDAQNQAQANKSRIDQQQDQIDAQAGR